MITFFEYPTNAFLHLKVYMGMPIDVFTERFLVIFLRLKYD